MVFSKKTYTLHTEGNILTSTLLAAGAVTTLPPVSGLVWGIFGAFVAVLLFLDLVVFNRKNEIPSLRHTVAQVALFVSAAAAAGVLIGLFTPVGWAGASQYFSAYVVEWSLSVDNVFVMSLVMAFFAVERQYQHKVLFYGVIGAIVMRLFFIAVGMAAVQKFSIILVVLGFVLIWSAYKLFASDDEDDLDIENMRSYKLLCKFLPIHNGFDAAHFVIRVNRKYKITKLLQAVFMVEIVDLIFAIDSVPAVLAISSNTFVAFSSNVMAILGLRSVYFLFDYIKDKLSRLNEGLAIVLGGIGIKMIIAHELNVGPIHWAGYHIETWVSLVFILVVLTGAVIASLIWPEKDDDEAVSAADESEAAPVAE